MVAITRHAQTVDTKHPRAQQQTTECVETQPARPTQRTRHVRQGTKATQKSSASTREHEIERKTSSIPDESFPQDTDAVAEGRHRPKSNTAHTALRYDDEIYLDDEGEEREVEGEENDAENAIRQYLAEIGRYPLLKAEQEMHLAKRVIDGD